MKKDNIVFSKKTCMALLALALYFLCPMRLFGRRSSQKRHCSFLLRRFFMDNGRLPPGSHGFWCWRFYLCQARCRLQKPINFLATTPCFHSERFYPGKPSHPFWPVHTCGLINLKSLWYLAVSFANGRALFGRHCFVLYERARRGRHAFSHCA